MSSHGCIRRAPRSENIFSICACPVAIPHLRVGRMITPKQCATILGEPIGTSWFRFHQVKVIHAACSPSLLVDERGRSDARWQTFHNAVAGALTRQVNAAAISTPTARPQMDTAPQVLESPSRSSEHRHGLRLRRQRSFFQRIQPRNRLQTFHLATIVHAGATWRLGVTSTLATAISRQRI